MVQVEKLKSSDLRASRGTLNVSEWMPRSVANYKATITEQEQQTIDNRVNKNYAMYSDTYKDQVRQDAERAVLNRKTELERKQLNRKRKRDLQEQAAYEWMNLEDNQKKRLAKAQLAYSNAADMIRAGQEMNWIRPDKWLSDKETVAYFIQANQETPFGEYVNRYMDSQVSDWYYDNEWLAIKLWLKEWTTSDKFQAGVGWYAQWLSDFAQNTVWRTAEYLWSNIAAGIWEWLYWIADFFWADTSEWSVWDKMKKAEWYSWEEAGKQASSEDMWKQWLLTEEQQAFDTGRWLWQLTTDIALTAPIEAGLWWAISASKAPKFVKFFLQAANLGAGWAAFQWVDDLANNELSDWWQYLKSALLNAWTGGLFNLIGKAIKIWKGAWYKLFWPKWQDETALFTQTEEKWANKTKINKNHAKDKNAKDTWYTELSNDLENAWEKTLGWRLEAWEKLWNIRNFELKYKPWEEYTTKNVLDDLNEKIWSLADKSKYWDKAWKAENLPRFRINEKWELEISNIDLLNKSSRNSNNKIESLWDKVKDAWAETYWRWAEINAATTEEFINKLDALLEWWWSGGDTNMIKLIKEWLNDAKTKWEKSLTEESLSKYTPAKAQAQEAITIDNDLNKLIKVLKSDNIMNKWAAETALWWKTQMEQLFKEINRKYWIDMNNEILAWAYNMSLYDVKKAKQIMETFYPSKPWAIEALLRLLYKQWARKQADRAVRLWKEWIDKLKSTPSKPWLIWWNAWNIISTQTNWVWENPRADN